MRMMEAGRGRKGTSDWITSEADRDLGTGQGCQRGGNHTREGSHRLTRGTPRSGRHGREAQMIRGGRRAGALSRWTVAPHPGEMEGGEAGAKREINGVDRLNIRGNRE